MRRSLSHTLDTGERGGRERTRTVVKDCGFVIVGLILSLTQASRNRHPPSLLQSAFLGYGMKACQVVARGVCCIILHVAFDRIEWHISLCLSLSLPLSLPPSLSLVLTMQLHAGCFGCYACYACTALLRLALLSVLFCLSFAFYFSIIFFFLHPSQV